VPKPSRLRSVNPTPAPAAQGAAAHPSGVSVETVLKPFRSADLTPVPAAQDAAARPSGVTVEALPQPLRSVNSTSTPAPQGVSPHPSGVSVEVLPKSGKRRSFSAAEKLRIVRDAAACTIRGDVEALLRREGIYSSHLAAWRKELALHGSEALAGRKPGRKPKLDAKDRRIAELENRNLRLEAKLSLAEKLIDLQKKVSTILGINLATDGEN
jgi:transposase